MHSGDINHRQPNSWTKLTVQVPRQLSDIVATFLADYADSGIEYSNGYTPNTTSQKESLSIYLKKDSNVNKKLESVHSLLDNLCANSGHEPFKTHTESIVEEDWGSNWKKHFKPFPITDRLTIKPSWEHYTPEPNETVLELDPGMAFGTGMHASTQLALKLIDHLYLDINYLPQKTLDVGTGTGILAMSCALLGSKHIIGIDNDVDARVAAAENITKNSLNDSVTIIDKDLKELNEKFDLVIANIIHNTLIELASSLVSHLQPNGYLIMAGILSGKQIDNIINIFSKLGMKVTKVKEQDEWSAVCLQAT